MANTVDTGRRSRMGRAVDVIDERLGVKALQYPVPEHANNLGWSLGGVTAATLMILVATGIILTQYYNPTPEVANASVRNITSHVWAGQFVRGVHYWSAQAMYVLAALHLLRVFLTGSYKRPREANWLIGVAMFALVTGALFTGTVIKWDQEGYEALGHNLEIARLLGGAGFWFNASFSGGVSLLERLYVAHIVIIPGLLFGLFAVHGMLIKRHGISPSPTVPDAPGEVKEPFTHHLRRVGAFGLVVFAAIGMLAVLRPPGVGATPVQGIEVTKPLWMFWWMFTLENKIGLKGILYGAGVLFGLLFALPFIDRNPKRWWRKRPVAITIAALVVAVLIVLTIMEALSTPVSHLG
jgi:ubiquinol-cytochrome c reductase cytochrome b subunit